MIKDTFAKDYKLKVKNISDVEMKTYEKDDFFMEFSKQAILGLLTEATLDMLFDEIKKSNIVNGIFDVRLDFGDQPGIDMIIDDTLITAYTYTAYEQLFTEVIEPHYGKGNVFAVIHGGRNNEGDEILPFMQLIFKIGNTDVAADKIPFETWLRPLQQDIVDYMNIIYPAYVTADQSTIKLKTWEYELNVAPLIEDSIMA